MDDVLPAAVREKNRHLNRWEQYYRTDSITSFPTHIQFPTGTRCNLRCRFCTERTGPGSSLYQYQDLSFADFIRIVSAPGWNRALQSVGTIALYGWGEPLFNPDYGKMVDYLLQRYPAIGLSISSNGVLFDGRWAEKMTEATDADLNFSVNAASAATYRNLMGSDQFHRVVRNIERLTTLRRQKRAHAPRVTLSYVVTTENIGELPRFVQLAAGLGVDSVVVQDIMTLNDATAALSLANEPELARACFAQSKEQARRLGVTLGFVSFETHREQYFPQTDLYQPGPPAPAPRPRPALGREAPSPYLRSTDCFDPWERFMIRADGEIFPCCRSQSHPDFTLGNVFRHSFQEIWNGQPYRLMRSTVNSADPPPVCRVCPRKAGLD